MKRFKEIYYKTLKEEYTEGGSVFNGYSDSVRRTAQSDFGVHRIGEGDSIHRLNAFINKFLGGTYIDPEAAVTELRSRLNHAGLDFVFDGKKITLHPGVNSFPAKLYGEVFGTTPTTDLSKGFDKGMDLPGLNLVIDVTYDENSCMYSMSGKLIPTPKTSPTTPIKEGAFGKMAGTFLGNLIAPGIGGVIGGMAGGALGDAVSSATSNDAQANGRASAMGENGMKRKKKIKKMSEGAGGRAVGLVAGRIAGGLLLPAMPIIGGIAGAYVGEKIGDAITGEDTQSTTPASSIPGLKLKQARDLKDSTGTNPLAYKGMNASKGTGAQQYYKKLVAEEKIEHVSDFPRKVEHFIMRDKDMKDKVLVPVFNHLLSKKKKGKLTLDDARKELYFVVNSALRKMKDTVEGDEKREVTLTQKEKGRVVGDLVRNFKKYMTTHATK